MISSTLSSLSTIIASNWSRYAPGDVAVIHPVAASEEVDAFLETAGWKDVADDPIHIEQSMLGQASLFFSTAISEAL